ncbi:hypothetical protein ILUMI_18283 [Ignelater luminosus]|uniref:DDE-1 domain-containing protein n=1 Tax=Ignelater luminosus TaxID=2038154 RepID=A0A8K0CQI1_IGNLU|nr:hypothetical protein ILUMI_18283 [Ignelater luminosus]
MTTREAKKAKGKSGKDSVSKETGYNSKRQPDLSPEIETDLVQHVRQLEEMFCGITRSAFMQLTYELAERNNLQTMFSCRKRSAEKDADETEHNVVQISQKILAQNGKHQSGSSLQLKRFKMSASRFFVSSYIKFPRKRMKDSLIIGAPPGILFRCQEKGWMNCEEFYQLVILRVKSIELARDNRIIMLSFPAHCFYKIQQLDVAFLKLLKAYFSATIISKMFENPEVPINVSYISSLVGIVIAAMQTLVMGFVKVTFSPRIDTFILTQIAPALVTDRPFVSGVSSIDEESLPKQLSEIVTISQLKDYQFTSGASYIQEAEINSLLCYSDFLGGPRQKRQKILQGCF